MSAYDINTTDWYKKKTKDLIQLKINIFFFCCCLFHSLPFLVSLFEINSHEGRRGKRSLKVRWWIYELNIDNKGKRTDRGSRKKQRRTLRCRVCTALLALWKVFKEISFSVHLGLASSCCQYFVSCMLSKH